MKILIATGIFPPEIGGPAPYAANLGTKLIQAGHIVDLVTFSDVETFEGDTKHPFQIKRIVREDKLSNYAKMFWYLLRNVKKYDVVYSLDWFSLGVPLYFASLITGKKYSVRVGGAYIWEKYLADNHPPVTLREFYEQELFRRYPLMFVLIKLVLKKATHVIFNSQIQAGLYKQYYGISDERISVIYNPVSRIIIPVTRTIPTKEIVFYGRFIAMKNIESLLRAFAKLKDTSYTLVLIGDGPRTETLLDLSKELNLTDRISWYAAMPQQQLYERIINCAYMVLPSWTDISPNQVYECLALGIPFLITKENFLAINEENFLTVDPRSVDDIAEKMNLLTDPKMYEQFMFDLKRIDFTYSWDEALRDHLEIFNNL
jgi:glycosyltransferase involved in cell wall biosynthesis